MPPWMFWTSVEVPCPLATCLTSIISQHMTKFKVWFVCYLDKSDFKSQSCDLEVPRNTQICLEAMKKAKTTLQVFQEYKRWFLSTPDKVQCPFGDAKRNLDKQSWGPPPLL
jgi:hypothetical protein